MLKAASALASVQSADSSASAISCCQLSLSVAALCDRVRRVSVLYLQLDGMLATAIFLG